MIEMDEYIGRKYINIVSARKEKNWVVESDVIQERSTDLNEWESLKVSFMEVNPELSKALAEIYYTTVVYMNRHNWDSFEIEEKPLELVN